MINHLFRYTLLFIILVLVQILILDNLQISSFVVPFLYVLFILMLPFEIPGWLLLLMAFFTGFVMDLFEHTYGIHTSATLLMAWFRPGVLKLIAPQDGYVPNSEPMIRDYGFSWFMKYSVILVFLHHAILFYFEVFTFHHFFTTLFRVFISSFFTIFLIVLSQFSVYKPKGLGRG
ncbi:MAG: rod shape-determining protein MreD [Bacteroidales bacterium]|nr:rod shape-determining protein MreD [Bacteroidales bacterium]